MERLIEIAKKIVAIAQSGEANSPFGYVIPDDLIIQLSWAIVQAERELLGPEAETKIGLLKNLRGGDEETAS